MTMLMLSLVITALVAFIYFFIIKPLSYWKERNVTQTNIFALFLNYYRTFSRQYSIPEAISLTYNRFPDERYIGHYQFSKPILMVRDPDLLRDIAIKKFDYFTDHTITVSENADPLWAKNLVSLKGQKWKEMRSILSPSFTSSKMKSIFCLMSECAEKFTNHFLTNQQTVTEVEMKDILTRYTNDVIATTAFGIKVDSLADRTNDFYMMGKNVTNLTGFVTIFKFFFISSMPKLAAALKIPLFDPVATQFFKEIIENTIKTREENGIVRPDMIHLLMEARKGVDSKEETNTVDEGFATAKEVNISSDYQSPKSMTNTDIAAQGTLFFLAGFDTVSTLMSFMAYELCVNVDIQNKLRQEIEETQRECKGNLTYEALLKMKYMDMIVSETLRKWPPSMMTERQCVKPFKVEPKTTKEQPFFVEKGVTVWLPIFAIHRDPKYYPNPEKFDPERFHEDNKDKISPYTYLPFGLGPRNCIGSRFALVEVKVLFYYLLSNFEIIPTEKTQIPLKLSKKDLNINAEKGYWFGLKQINN